MRRMMRILLAAFLLVAACGEGKTSDVNENLLRPELTKGLESINVTLVPIGEIEIISGLFAPFEGNDFKTKRFRQDYLAFLKRMEAQGLLSLVEHSEDPLQAFARSGARRVTVKPSEELKASADAKMSTKDYLAVKSAICKVKDIIKVTPYESPNLPKSEEYVLVLGTHVWTPINFTLKVYPERKQELFKFRALLKFDPFTKSYTFYRVDWGYLDKKNEWETQSIK